MSRGRHAGNPTIFLREHRLDRFRRKLAQPDLDQRAYNPSAHFVKETISLDDEGQQGTVFFELASGDCADGRLFGVALAGGKGGKIVTPDEAPRGLPHSGGIQGPGTVPGRMAN